MAGPTARERVDPGNARPPWPRRWPGSRWGAASSTGALELGIHLRFAETQARHQPREELAVRVPEVLRHAFVVFAVFAPPMALTQDIRMEERPRPEAPQGEVSVPPRHDAPAPPVSGTPGRDVRVEQDPAVIAPGPSSTPMRRRWGVGSTGRPAGRRRMRRSVRPRARSTAGSPSGSRGPGTGSHRRRRRR